MLPACWVEVEPGPMFEQARLCGAKIELSARKRENVEQGTQLGIRTRFRIRGKQTKHWEVGNKVEVWWDKWWKTTVESCDYSMALVHGTYPQGGGSWDLAVPLGSADKLLRPALGGIEEHTDFCGVDKTSRVAGLDTLTSRGCGQHFLKSHCFCCDACTLIWCDNCLEKLGSLVSGEESNDGVWRCPV